jgi:hypothetical protein
MSFCGKFMVALVLAMILAVTLCAAGEQAFP